MISLFDVQRGYDAWAAKPHNSKWARRIDGTPIPNDVVVTIFDTLRDQGDEWFDKVIGFFVEHGMLDQRDEYDLDDVMSALRDNYEPKPSASVKPLEWREHPNSFPAPMWSAQTPFGFYNIEEVSASDSPAYEVRLHSHHLVSVKDGLPEAKDAAQQDYETRVKSALTVDSDRPSTGKEGELIRAGAAMACVCFNLSQVGSIPDEARKALKDAQVEWDAARSALTRALAQQREGK